MPTGVPIATVGVDAAVNAAVLAAEIVGHRRRRDPGGTLEVQGRPGGGPQAVDPSLPPPRDGRRLVGRGTSRELARDRAARGGSVGRARRDPAGGRRAHAASARRSRSRRCSSVEAVTRHDVAAFVDVVAGLDRRRGPMDPLRPDVVATCSTQGSALQLRAAADVLLAELETPARRREAAAPCSTVTR